jgi:hypothetical protein
MITIVCCIDGHTNKDYPNVRNPNSMSNTNLFHENMCYKLFIPKNENIKAKAIGPPDKKRKVEKI